MPSHKIHLVIAKKVNDSLNLDLDSVLLGSIMPDICVEQHFKSHFQSGKTDLERLANPDTFIEKYRDKINNPIMIGYLIHLLTDRYYNEYFYKNYYIYDEDGNGIGMYLKGKKKIINVKKRKYLKHRDFDLYDKWLLNHKMVPKFNNYKCIENIVSLEEATYNEEDLLKYINKSNNDIDKVNFFNKIMFYNYSISSKKELDKIFNNCIVYILNYLSKNKIISEKA